MADVTAHLRLDGSTLLSVRADPETYAQLIDALLDDGRRIEGTTEAEMVLAVAAMDDPRPTTPPPCRPSGSPRPSR